MSRVASRTKSADRRSEQTHNDPKSGLANDMPATSPPGGRGPDGRFAMGNRGGPGNPHARHCARMLELFRNCISDDEMIQLFRILYTKAMDGDVSAAKLVLAYKVGKPVDCPNPDTIDRDEWDHYQQDAIEPNAMQQVLSSLPTRVGNDIVRTALPIVTEVRTRELATQMEGQQIKSPEVTAQRVDVDKINDKPAPIPNGNVNVVEEQLQGDADREQSNTKVRTVMASNASSRRGWVPDEAIPEPIPNGNSRKKRRPQERAVIAKRSNKKRAG
jgi:hypothetical protein